MSTFSGSSIQSTLSSLISGRERLSFQPQQCKYVCHSSTIPLATTVDEQFVLGNSDFPDLVDVSHSSQYIAKDLQAFANNYKCCKKHCMYMGSRKESSQKEILRGNCPCGEVIRYETIGDEEVEICLQPVCFLQVLKELRYDFGYVDRSETQCETDEECCHNTIKRSALMSNRPRLNFKDVMFCQNSQSIMDERYSAALRSSLKFSGWEDVKTPERLHEVLTRTYWYRKFASRDLKLAIQAEREQFSHFKQCISHTLHTVNGLIHKKLLFFPCEMEGYSKLAELTAEVFEAILDDYVGTDNRPSEATPENSVFLRMKDSFKFVKEHLHQQNAVSRMSCLNVILEADRRCKFARFFGPAFSRLAKRIRTLSGSDYTRSVAWINTMTGFSQTRSMGYLPEWIALKKRKEFRETIGRPMVSCTTSDLKLVYDMVQRRQADMGIVPLTLETDNEMFNDAVSAIEVPLKGTASIAHTVADGGKIEDARELLNIGIHHKWRVPRIDFKTGKVKDWFFLTEELRNEKPNYQGYLFWTALQVVCNALHKQKGRTEFEYRELPGSEKFENDVFRMAIVHISEPAKERNLTKGSGPLAWVLTIISKVSQAILANNQDHRAGLVLSAQDWMHQRRVSAESPESHFIYDSHTGLRHEEIWNGFQDWTESTDYIPRQIGGVALKSWLDFIGFPTWLKRVGLVLSQVVYTVEEVLETDFSSGIMRHKSYHGVISEGYMMGNPLTKTILHLMHDVSIGTAHMLLREIGVVIPNWNDSWRQEPILADRNQFYLDPEIHGPRGSPS